MDTGVRLPSPPLFCMVAINNNMAIQSLAYLKTKFEKGDYPDQNDFNDLIESCFNYSLSDTPDFITAISSASANWESTYNTVDANSDDWDAAYALSTRYSMVSSSYVTNANLTNSYLKLSGGTITNNLNVQGALLSAGSNLFNLFLTPNNGFQNLTYNKDNYLLSIASGNSVSLSSVRPTMVIPFTHASSNLQNNRMYIFGQLSVPALTSINFSNCYRSFNSGTIRELTMQNSYSAGTSEPVSFFLVNRTQNLTAQLVQDIRYTETLASENTNLTNNLKGGLPSNPVSWSATGGVVFGANGASFSDSLQTLTTCNLVNGTKYQELSVYAMGDGGGNTAGVRLLYSQDGTNYAYAINNNSNNSTRTATNANSLLNWGTITIPGGISSNFSLKLEVTQQVLISNLSVTGYFPVDTKLSYLTLNNPMSVLPGDLLDIRFTTNAFVTPPTNVVNLVNAKLDVTA